MLVDLIYQLFLSVAIYCVTELAKGNEKQDFLSEIEMMKKVAEGQNPHVVCLVGCVTIQEPLCLITEFVKYGDLISYLRTNRRMVLSVLIYYHSFKIDET